MKGERCVEREGCFVLVLLSVCFMGAVCSRLLRLSLSFQFVLHARLAISLLSVTPVCQSLSFNSGLFPKSNGTFR